MSHALARPEQQRLRRRTLLPRLWGYLLLALGAGALAGVLWWLVVDLPGYLVQPDGSAATSERQLAEFVAGDAWFTVIGALVSVALGWLAWARLRSLGWPVVLVSAGSATAAALVCWFVGYHLGPDEFNQRLAVARPGETVPIELTLRAKASLLVWPFVATVPVLLGSSLAHDEEEPRPLRRPPYVSPVFRRRSRRPEPPSR